jgi:hypothetical protein
MKENIIERIVYDILQDKKLSGFSTKWANWESKLTLMTCQPCVDKHGTIVDIRFAELKPNVMAHERCKCEYVPMRVKKAGRIWYEADINYDDGYRNHQRILYSNDGLIFVSYDHYQTYYEIT